tara:strand:- start:33 stop:422 length:390 start_codon:yes stop_codon:yes gene_type:complete
MTQTPSDRHPDIEIYLKQQSIEKITDWLTAIFEQCDTLGKRGHTHNFRVTYQGISIPVTVIDRASKEFTSIWFDSPDTPWALDLDCARQAQQQLTTEVRCIASGWKEGDEPDEWWSLTEQGENLILWQG